VLMAVWREYLGAPHPQPHIHRPTATPSV
jgi:hypothetical protein